MGLWTRLIGFTPDELSALVIGRQVARGWLMRATVHLVTADDFASIRPVLDTVLASRFPYYQQLPGVDRAELATAAREVLGERPLSRADLGRALAPRWPDAEADILGLAITYLVPLVQLPPRGVWGSNAPSILSVAPVSTPSQVDELVLRYLGAFGPDMRLPDPDVPAPIRFLPEYDNLLLSHADRSRFIEDGRRVPLPPGNGANAGTVLVDGWYRADWRIERSKDQVATLIVRPFGALNPAQRHEIEAEGRELLAFAAAGSEVRDVRIVA